MWVAKIQFDSSGTLIGSKTGKYKINLFGFPLSYVHEKEWIILQFACRIFGKDKDKKDFIKALKDESRVINLELRDDFLIGIIREPLHTKCIYNKEIIHTSPAYISEKGYEIINIASFERKNLNEVAKIFRAKYTGKLLSIKQTKLKSISVMKMGSELTTKQREAIELAIKNGYYNSPRKIDIKTLAKLSKLSFSTYQVHLRKAESKTIPYVLD